MVEERGFCANRGGELSPLAYHGRPKKRERKKGINGEVCGVCWKIGKDWNFEKLEKLVACGGRKRNKEKGKRKRIDKEKIFSLTRKMKILETQISGFKSRIRKTFRKIPKSSKIQVSRNDS